MARYPGAVYRALGTQTEPRMSRHNIFCVHTMVGYLWGTDNMFKRDGYYGTESHFGVGGSSDGADDGKVIQWQDTAYCADANLDGKPEVISVETSDGGNPDRPWSSKQLDALVKLGIWVCKTHDIPPVLIPDTQPGRRGIGYHRMGCDHSSSYRPKGWPYDKWREPGGVKWSSSLGKTCPGNVRIKQLVDIVIPRIKAGVQGTEDDVSAEEIWGFKDDDSTALAYVKSGFKNTVTLKYAASRIEKAVALLLDDEEKLAALIKEQAEATAAATTAAVERWFTEHGGDPTDVAAVKEALKEVLREGVA